MTIKVNFLIVFIWIVNPLVNIVSASDYPITVHYHERVPYHTKTSDGIRGLVGTPANLAFKNANVPYVWTLTPPKRQLKLIEDNKGLDCIVGWFKNSERERYSKFTHSIYQDKALVALARADNNNIQSGETVSTLLSSSKFTMLIKDGYSYGTYIDQKINQYKPMSYKATAENVAMLKMINQRRIDYFFISPEEADSLINLSEIPKYQFKYITFLDVPKGEKRYILCSKNVDDSVIEKLNSAILND